jgi:single-strand DNA-binding protein
MAQTGFSFNLIIVAGNLGADQETRFTQNEVGITNFSLVTVHTYKKNDDWEEEKTWHNVTVFQASDYMKNNLKKGAKVLVQGRFQKRKYQDKNNNDRYADSIIAEKIVFLNSKNGSSSTMDETEEETSEDLPF